MGKDKIIGDMKAAMKSGDKLRLSTVRMLLSEVKYAEIKKGEPLSEEELEAVVGRELKKRREAIPLYREGGREALAEQEEAEAAVLLEYLPPQLTEPELTALIDGAVEATGAASLAEMGKVMAILAPKIKGRADGAAVSQAVKARLRQADTV